MSWGGSRTGDGVDLCPPAPAPGSDDTAWPALDELMGLFRSLGDNCELGLVQRYAGAEPIDLLRFAGAHIATDQRLRVITDAIANGFQGLGEPGTVSCGLGEPDAAGRREYYIQENVYQLRYHTFRYDDRMDPERLIAQQMELLQHWRAKLFEDLRFAQKICVWKSNATQPDSDIRALSDAIRRYGPNDLLWLTLCDEDHDVGDVDDLGGGLFRGHVARFAPYERAGDIDFRSWFLVCARAYQLIPLLRQKQLHSIVGFDVDTGAYDGSIDGLIGDRLCGWCAKRGDPRPVWLQLFVDGRLFAIFPANEPRADLEQVGIVGGNHGFCTPVTLRGLPATARVAVRILGTTIDIPHSGRGFSTYRRLDAAPSPHDPREAAVPSLAQADSPVPPELRDTLTDIRGSAERIALEILACPPKQRREAVGKTYGVFLAIARARGCSEVVAADFARLMRQMVRDVIAAAELTGGKIGEA